MADLGTALPPRARVTLLCILAALALAAAAPPQGSEDYEALHSFSAWVQHAETDDGRLCCSMADGRIVDARTAGDHWQIRFLHPETLHDAPVGWVDVPPDAVLRIENPTGFSVAWWYNGVVRCFAPGGGV